MSYYVLVHKNECPTTNYHTVRAEALVAADLKGIRTARELAAAIEDRIRTGAIDVGERLPTVRSLAADLGVSPMTVATAYRELRYRGIVTTGGRRGTRVTERPPVRLSGRSVIPPGVRDLASGNPDPAFLPSLEQAFAEIDPRPRLYGAEASLPELADSARRRFSDDGVDVASLTVVAGTLDAIDRVLGAHLRAGDSIAVEDPGYARVYDLLRGAGFEPVPMRVDDFGLLADDLERAVARGASAVIVTPRAQNPFGSAIDESRAADLRAVLERHPDVLIVEDDHAGASAGTSAHTIHPPAHPRWAISRSVSKTLGPDLRLAVLAGDVETIGRVEGRRMLGTGWVSHIIQQLVVALWSDPEVNATMARSAEIYAERRSALIDALADRGIAAHGRSGLNVWIPVDEETTAVTGLLQRGWAVTAGERWRLRSGPAVRVTTAALPSEEASAFASALVEVMSSGGRGYDT
jgi:DNA-binding transcriptional MocR family regulator